MGPIGSGKTTGCLLEFLRRAVRQKPSPIDNIRYTRFIAMRDTYRNLERTTIPSWLDWVPKEAGSWKGGSSGEPGIHIIHQKMRDGTEFHLEVRFLAVQDADLEDVFRGFPVTGVFINEGDRLPTDVIHLARQRAGRYPPQKHGGASWRGVWCDFNAPNFEDEFDEYFGITDETLRAPNIGFFRQPGGRDPDAENIENLPSDYYEELMVGMPDYWVARMIDNKLGHSRTGKPVFPEFSSTFHVAKHSIAPIKGREIVVGADAGRTPAAIFMQKDSEGQIRCLREFICEDVGAQAFGELLADFAAENFPDHYDLSDREGRPLMRGVGDPAADNPTETSNKDDDAWLEIVSRASGIRFKPAKTNKLTIRLEALRQLLMKPIKIADKPAIIFSREMRILKKALAYGYIYAKRKISGPAIYNEIPDKHGWASHPVDAAIYAIMELSGLAEIMGRPKRANPAPAKTIWRPSDFA